MTKALRKKQHRGIIEAYERLREEFTSGEKFSTTTFGDLLKEFFRYRTHPHVVELRKKYPMLLDNDAIYARLTEKYPSIRMSDEEYTAHLKTIYSDPNPLLKRIKGQADWRGGEIQVPFR